MHEFIKKYLFLILVLSVFTIGFILRFYKLSEIPNGLYPDETAIGYNAYSILTTGKDEYGVEYPLYFKSFDDYKLPVYIYLTVFTEKIFDVTPFAVRLPSAFFGTFSLVIFFLLLYELSRKKWFSLIGTIFLAINPWHMFFSRAGYEVNVATFFILLGVYFFMLGINRRNNIFLLTLSVIPFILSVYTYNVTRLIAPIILLSLFAFYYKRLKKNKINIAVPILIFVFCLSPFLITSINLQSEAGFSSHMNGLIFGDQIKAQLIETRSYFISLPDIIEKIFFNYWVLVAWTYFKNLVSFFSTSFFFITGSDKPNQNLSAGLSMFYYFDFFLIIIGAFEGIKRKATFLYPFYIWFVVVFLVGSLVTVVPNGTRTYPVVIPLVVFAAYGLYVILNFILKNKNFYFKLVSITTISLIFFYSVIFYMTSYFVRFPVGLAEDWKSEDVKLAEFLLKNGDNYTKIVFDDSAEMVYTNFLFYTKFSPELLQKEGVYEQNGLVSKLQKVSKYEFRKVNWRGEMEEWGGLFITGESSRPEGIEPVAVIKYPTKPVAVFYDRRIGQYPLTQTAYLIFKSEGKN